MKAMPLHFIAALALACSLWSLTSVLVADRANASTITFTLSLTQTAGGATLVGEPDSVSSLDFIGSPHKFSQHIDTLSPVISQDVTKGTPLFEVDFTAFEHAVSPPIILGTYAFQNVLFTAVTLGANGEDETVSFIFATETFTPASTNAVPLPATLPLFATGVGVLGLLGWCRTKTAALNA
jgi:hypothetical protein